jgi:hypothetical protein
MHTDVSTLTSELKQEREVPYWVPRFALRSPLLKMWNLSFTVEMKVS